MAKRASTGTAVRQTNCHPFRRGRWMCMHNGAIAGFHSMRRELHPDMAFLPGVSDETRLIVSEPLGDLPGAWNEVPESSYGVVQAGADELHPFVPEPA